MKFNLKGILNIIIILFSPTFLILVGISRSFYWLIFISFVPLLWINLILIKRKYGFILSLIINLITIFIWYYASLNWVIEINKRALIISIIQSLLYSIPFIFFNFFIKKQITWLGIFGFIVVWLALEYIQTLGQLAFPLFSLGNLLASVYTG